MERARARPGIKHSFLRPPSQANALSSSATFQLRQTAAVPDCLLAARRQRSNFLYGSLSKLDDQRQHIHRL
jgi:hypothetical protein